MRNKRLSAVVVVVVVLRQYSSAEKHLAAPPLSFPHKDRSSERMQTAGTSQPELRRLRAPNALEYFHVLDASPFTKQSEIKTTPQNLHVTNTPPRTKALLGGILSPCFYIRQAPCLAPQLFYLASAVTHRLCMAQSWLI